MCKRRFVARCPEPCKIILYYILFAIVKTLNSKQNFGRGSERFMLTSCNVKKFLAVVIMGLFLSRNIFADIESLEIKYGN